ncbi:MAG: RNA 3'-terminal phosphate cyclase [Desulfobulbaceae bacterium]|nr:RNA 3'-terminal phosphate cyclase [Desulfobulbaceae bacterium]
MIVIDGSVGEGGGQTLRTALSLSLVSGKPFSIYNIRGNRPKPGLLRQHLTAVNSAVQVGNAKVSGNVLGSGLLVFEPGVVSAGPYHFAVGTAGSAVLVAQTVLPPLLLASKESHLVLEGGSHNPHAPSYDYFHKVFLPLINKMGPKVTAQIDRYGFYPAGGGKFEVFIRPTETMAQIHIPSRGESVFQHAEVIISRLPRHIAIRELKVIAAGLLLDDERFVIKEAPSPGPGNVIQVECRYAEITELFMGVGIKGIPAERIAQVTVREVKAYLDAGVPVGPWLADQLLIPMAISGGGSFRTMKPTLHTWTNIEIIKSFLPVDIQVKEEEDNAWLIQIIPLKSAGPNS